MTRAEKILDLVGQPDLDEAIPKDLVLIPDIGDLDDEGIRLVDKADWYEPRGGGPILVSAKAIDYLSEDDPIDAGLTPEDLKDLVLIDHVLHRWSDKDGFYHA